jgi:1,4-alpha-glucan branching enzyme
MSTPRQGVTPIPKVNHTVFACDSDTATALFLAGSFNNWNSKSTPMTRDNRGHWTVSLPLAPGRYEYKFVVDGEWCCEPGCTYKEVHCPHCTMNEFGTMNRVVEVQ